MTTRKTSPQDQRLIAELKFMSSTLARIIEMTEQDTLTATSDYSQGRRDGSLSAYRWAQEHIGALLANESRMA